MTTPWSAWDCALRWACAAHRRLEGAAQAASPLVQEICSALDTWSKLRR